MRIPYVFNFINRENINKFKLLIKKTYLLIKLIIKIILINLQRMYSYSPFLSSYPYSRPPASPYRPPITA